MRGPETALRRTDPPSPQEVREALARLLASASFEASDRRRAFLDYIVTETLAGRNDRLKGYGIALAVFGRDETFDSGADPVVRLEARRLRRDLDSYYMGAGSRDPVRISIPKGAYVPFFEWRDPPPAPLAAREETPREAAAEPPHEAAPLTPAGPEAIEGTEVAAADDSPVAPAATTAPVPTTASATAPALAPTMESAMESAPAVALAAVPDATPAPALAPAPGRRTRRLALAGALLALVLLAGAATWWALAPAPSDDLFAGTGEPALLVRPFRVLGTSPDERFLAEGMSEELVSHLMRFAGLRVYMPPEDAAETPRDIAYLVRGSVGIRGNEVTIATQLTDVKTGEVLWADTYDRELTPEALAGVQRDVTGEIASILAQPYGVVNEDLARRIGADATDVSLPSYLCVMRAYVYRREFTRREFPSALACLENAVRRDPTYVDALAMLGWLYLDGGRFEYLDQPREESYARAHEIASRAVELDPRNPLALKALASINHYMGRFAESERLARQAVALNPNDPDALAQLGWRLAVRGNFEEGIPLVKRAVARSVNPPGWYLHLITIDLYLKGDYRQMLSLAQMSVRSVPGVSDLLVAVAAGAIDDPETARRALARLDGYEPFTRDPAAFLRRHGATDAIVGALLAGLAKARAVAG